MIALLPPIIVLALLLGVIWYLGGAGFGRGQTQVWIDRVRAMPRLHAFLDKHHGKFRASGHYFEFGGLFLALYWLVGTATKRGMAWNAWLAIGIGVVCVIAAVLDELHQLKGGTRQFRREDLLHSTCGIALAAAMVFYADMFAG